MRCTAITIFQVGVNVNTDASFLNRDYDVEVAATVDLRTHVRERWVATPSRSLAGMVSALMGKELRKIGASACLPGKVLTSRTTGEEQVNLGVYHAHPSHVSCIV